MAGRGGKRETGEDERKGGREKSKYRGEEERKGGREKRRGGERVVVPSNLCSSLRIILGWHWHFLLSECHTHFHGKLTHLFCPLAHPHPLSLLFVAYSFIWSVDSSFIVRSKTLLLQGEVRLFISWCGMRPAAL